jgi:hypothetical protein
LFQENVPVLTRSST